MVKRSLLFQPELFNHHHRYWKPQCQNMHVIMFIKKLHACTRRFSDTHFLPQKLLQGGESPAKSEYLHAEYASLFHCPSEKKKFVPQTQLFIPSHQSFGYLPGARVQN